jgi:YegS/Rv2252/BmrU family lipid kinase
MSTILLVNPAAGRGRATQVEREVRQSAELHWRDVTVLRTNAPGEGVELVRKATEAGASRILVLGGDGTVHEAANGILQAKRERLPPLGIIPVGTGNDYAKLTGTHGKSPLAALAHLLHGRVAMYDVGKAWDEYFLNSIGIGFDAMVASRVNGYRRLRGPVAYVSAALLTFRTYRPFTATVRYGEESFTEPLLLLEAGIGAVVGGGFRLTPHAVADDGLFDVCALRGVGVLGFLTKLPLAMLGWHTGLAGVRMFRTTEITVEGKDGPLIAQLDGEVRSAGARIQITIHPGRLPILMAGRRPSAQWERPAQ